MDSIISEIILIAGEKIHDKKVSAMNYYAYRFMVRPNGDNNHILKC